jgi:hypothetical protein
LLATHSAVAFAVVVAFVVAVVTSPICEPKHTFKENFVTLVYFR